MTVIKCGGSTAADWKSDLIPMLTSLQDQKEALVLVHGGGPAIAELGRALGLESEFAATGERITGAAFLNVVLQALCGQVNSQLVALLQSTGFNAFGLSGLDGRLLEAELIDYSRLGFVGKIRKVRSSVLENLCGQEFVPVVSPVSFSAGPVEESSLSILNVNADSAAAAVAAALGARTLIFISDVPGVLGADGERIPRLESGRIESLIGEGVAFGGMIPKLRAAAGALEQGVGEVLLVGGNVGEMDWSQAGRGKAGTVIVR